MTSTELISRRLSNQQITETRFSKPQEIVKWMVAMQAQEFAMAKWAVGLRLNRVTDGDVEQAFNDGLILRTHVMRPTWHFVTPADIRWMLALTAPRVHAASAYMYRQVELDSKIFKRSNDAIARALEGGQHLIRPVLKSVLERARIPAVGFRLGYLIMNAELEGVICSGPRQGKQFTYALLDERVPATRVLSREESLASLTERYFASRGPATLQDFVTWSGLTMKDANAGAAMLPRTFIRISVAGQGYIYAPPSVTKLKPKRALPACATFLMPDYDEYGIGYKDRRAIFDSDTVPRISRGNPVFNRMIIIDGKIAGTWKRTLVGKKVQVETYPFTSLSKSNQQLLTRATRRFSEFAMPTGR